MTERLFSPTDILLRYVLLWVCLSAAILAQRYMPERWSVLVALIAGYEMRCVILVFGMPFQRFKD